MIIALVGLMVFEPHVSGSRPWLLALPLFVDGLGMGLILGPLANTVMAGVEPRHLGAASGVFNTGLQVGTAAGVALVGTVFYANLTAHTVAGAHRHAFVHVLPYLIGVAVLVAVLAQLLPSRKASAAKN
jgi:MFS family permease